MIKMQKLVDQGLDCTLGQLHPIQHTECKVSKLANGFNFILDLQYHCDFFTDPLVQAQVCCHRDDKGHNLHHFLFRRLQLYREQEQLLLQRVVDHLLRPAVELSLVLLGHQKEPEHAAEDFFEQ